MFIKPSGVLIDTNVLMDILLDREHRAAAEKMVAQVMHEPGLTLAVSILTVSTLLYYVEKDRLDKHAAHAFLANYKILDMNESDYLWAADNDQNDFEDALQVACALRHNCHSILTLDKGLADNHRKHIITTLIR